MMKTTVQFLEDSYNDKIRGHRDKMVSTSCASRAFAEIFDERAEYDERDFRRIIFQVAEIAAFLAIQEDRSQHQNEIALLDKYHDSMLRRLSARPMPIVVDKEYISGIFDLSFTLQKPADAP